MLTSTALEKWRALHGLTQDEAATLAGHTTSSWRNWEKGRSQPGADVVALLEQAHPGLHLLLTKPEPRTVSK